MCGRLDTNTRSFIFINVTSNICILNPKNLGENVVGPTKSLDGQNGNNPYSADRHL